MKCTKCGKDNRIKANYCSDCGNPFTKQEQQAQYDQTIYGKIDKLIDLKEWLDFSKITSNIFFRIGVIVILAILVIQNVRQNGSELAIRNSDAYSIAYQEELDEFYLLTNEEKVEVNVYVPKKTEAIYVETYNQFDELLSEEMFDVEDGIILQSTSDQYYRLIADYENDEQEMIKFFVCEASDDE